MVREFHQNTVHTPHTGRYITCKFIYSHQAVKAQSHNLSCSL